MATRPFYFSLSPSIIFLKYIQYHPLYSLVLFSSLFVNTHKYADRCGRTPTMYQDRFSSDRVPLQRPVRPLLGYVLLSAPCLPLVTQALWRLLNVSQMIISYRLWYVIAGIFAKDQGFIVFVIHFLSAPSASYLMRTCFIERSRRASPNPPQQR